MEHESETYEDMREKQLRREIEKKQQQPGNITSGDIDPVVASNIENMSNVLGINKTEKTLLTFLVVLKSHESLIDATEKLNKMTLSGVCSVLSDLLVLENSKVVIALSSQGMLRKSGLVIINPDSSNEFNKIIRLTGGFAGQMMFPHESVFELLERYFSPIQPCELKLNDFPHLKEDIQLIRNYLTGSCRRKAKGVNIPSKCSYTITVNSLVAKMR